MINPLMENTQRKKRSPMLYTLRVLQNTDSEDIDLDAAQRYDSCIGKISPQELWSAVIGRYYDVMDVS